MQSEDEEDKRTRTERAMRMARKIIDGEWIAAGVTREELDQDEQLTDIFSRLRASGRSMDDINAEWEHKTPAKILREYAVHAPMLPDEKQSAVDLGLN